MARRRAGDQVCAEPLVCPGSSLLGVCLVLPRPHRPQPGLALPCLAPLAEAQMWLGGCEASLGVSHCCRGVFSLVETPLPQQQLPECPSPAAAAPVAPVPLTLVVPFISSLLKRLSCFTSPFPGSFLSFSPIPARLPCTCDLLLPPGYLLLSSQLVGEAPARGCVCVCCSASARAALQREIFPPGFVISLE